MQQREEASIDLSVQSARGGIFADEVLGVLIDIVRRRQCFYNRMEDRSGLAVLRQTAVITRS